MCQYLNLVGTKGGLINLVLMNMDTNVISLIFKFKYFLDYTRQTTMIKFPLSMEVNKTAYNEYIENCKDKNFLIRLHTKEIYSMAPFETYSKSDYGPSLNKLRIHVQVLQSLDGNQCRWKGLLSYIIHSKLDESTKCEWQKKMFKQKVPMNASEMLLFLTSLGTETKPEVEIRNK